ncbi:MAG: cupin domain-containing protein [Candidatus Aenigmatarchaeota archaeon]
MKTYKFDLKRKGRVLGFSTGDTNISIATSEPNHIDPFPHFHSFSDEFYITLSGVGIIRINDERYLLRPDKIIKIEKNEIHQIIGVYKHEKYCDFIHISIKVPDEKDDKVIVK